MKQDDMENPCSSVLLFKMNIILDFSSDFRMALFSSRFHWGYAFRKSLGNLYAFLTSDGNKWHCFQMYCLSNNVHCQKQKTTEQNILPYMSKAVKLDKKVSIELLRSAVLNESIRTAEVRSSMDTFHCAQKCP